MSNKSTTFALAAAISLAIATGVGFTLYANSGTGARADRTAAPTPSESERVPAALPGAADSGQDFDPDRGIWPGLLSAGPMDVADGYREVDFESTGLRDLPDHEPGKFSPLVERIEAFGAQPDSRKAAAAYSIAAGWRRCRLHLATDVADLREVARNRYENSMRMAETRLAEYDDEARVESEIRRIAEVDREAAIAFIHRELASLDRLCAGTGSLTLDEREARVFEWIDRAAALGHPAARADYAWLAFQGRQITPGKASLLVERKHRVARYVREMLDDRDVRGLELLGFIVEQGYYDSPDSLHAYAYTKAALEIAGGAMSTAWRVPGDDDRNTVALEWRLAQAEDKLDAAALARAEDLARRILEIPN